jgi:predicted transcriptional regulator of viral defense system
MSALEVLARLATEVAEDQWGLVTRAQAMDLGVAPVTFARLVDAGVLVRVAHGVYRIAGGVDPGHLELRAAWLQLDPEIPAWQRVRAADVAVVSHRSAAELYGLGDLIADIHEFSVPFRRQTRREDVRLHRGRIPAVDRTLVGGLPVTRPHRLVADLVVAHEDGSAVVAIAVEAIDRGLTTAERIAGAVAQVDPNYDLLAELMGRAA